MSRRYTGSPSRADAERLGRQIDRHPAGERVGDDQRRRREVVRAHLLLDAPLEVAIAAQHRGDDQVACLDVRRHVVGQRAAVADAGRAAVADEIEAELRRDTVSGPALRRYSVTTFEPGARLVFTHGLRVRPRSTAFFASRPAPIITLGFDVFVQLVIAAITTAP